MSLLSCAMPRASKKQKYGRKNRESSFFLPQKTTTRSTRGQHAISDTNTVTTRLISTFLVLFLSCMHCQISSAVSVNLSNMRRCLKGPCTPFLTRLPKQSLIKTSKKQKWPKLTELVTAIMDHVGG